MGALVMEPSLAYGSYVFHPLEDENLPRTICRDVPGEFRVSQLIHKYFKYKDPEGIRLVIRNDEDEIYRLMTEGMDEFRSWEMYMCLRTCVSGRFWRLQGYCGCFRCRRLAGTGRGYGVT